MSTATGQRFTEGQKVYWNDPDNGLCSGWATIDKVHGDDDPIAVLTMEWGGETEARFSELSTQPPTEPQAATLSAVFCVCGHVPHVNECKVAPCACKQYTQPTSPQVHTATPWRVSTIPSVEFDEADTPARFISNDASNGLLAVATAHGDNQQEADANAAHIVHCVNQHDKLIAALREVAIPSLRYCEEKYGYDDQARLNLEAALAAKQESKGK